MSTFENRPNSALLVVDMQNGVIEGAYKRDAVVANIGSLIGKARRERVPIIWVKHSDGQLARGADNWRIVAELNPGNAEPLVEKNYGDSFEATTLETVLSGLGVGRLVVVGAQSDACIRSNAPRGVRQGLRRDPSQRSPHDGGPHGMGGHRRRIKSSRAHKPVLEVPDGARADGRDGRDKGCPLRWDALRSAELLG
jgi:Isochorismatase family